MHDSLSILLPVHNAQQTLQANVMRILEVLPEISDRVDLLIIDDASNDGTEEIAWELMMHYPQVDFIRHPLRQGTDESVRTGIQQTVGRYVLVVEDQNPVNVEQLLGLWQSRELTTQQLLDVSQASVSASDNHGMLSWIVGWARQKNLATASMNGLAARLRLVRRDSVGEQRIQNGSSQRDTVTAKTYMRHGAHHSPRQRGQGSQANDRARNRV